MDFAEAVRESLRQYFQIVPPLDISKLSYE
jgi:hypothetical protein